MDGKVLAALCPDQCTGPFAETDYVFPCLSEESWNAAKIAGVPGLASTTSELSGREGELGALMLMEGSTAVDLNI
jgi:hypothetical protein